jgi:hypothetical protein
METELATTVTTALMPWIILIIAGIIVLWIKELVTDIVASVRWKIKPGFEPGDTVYLDDERATIISIGYRETIFEFNNSRGKVWRHIDNTRIPYVKLERIITDTAKQSAQNK